MTFHALLVIGIHREELAFGDQVAKLLKDSSLDVLRIGEGISSERPSRDNLFYYKILHDEIYLQLLQGIGRRYSLMIDLHAGIDETSRCAEVFCRDTEWLYCLRGELSTTIQRSRSLVKTFRLTNIVANAEPAEHVVQKQNGRKLAYSNYSICKTHIPEALWANRRFLYVGIEIYLPQPGIGERDDWNYAAAIVNCVQACERTYSKTR